MSSTLSLTNFTILAKFKFPSANALNLDHSSILLLKSSTFTRRQNFSFVLIEPFAEDKLNDTQNIKSVFHKVGNMVGKGENAGYQHFLLFPQCFQKALSSAESKVCISMEAIHCVIMCNKRCL